MMSEYNEIRFMNTRMHALTCDQTVKFINKRILKNEFTQHVVVNVAKLVQIQENQQLKKSVEDCDIINVDGMGVVWGARLLGNKVPERVSGIDLFYRLLSFAETNKYPIFLLGAKDEVVTAAVKRIKQQYPDLNIAGYHHGYFWGHEEEIVRKIKTSGAKLLFVAITSPKKENFINKWKEQLGVKFVMGVGGTFDVVAGVVRRAPVWMQKTGMEWLYRVIQEPRRMWKRYVFTNAKYAIYLIGAKIRMLFVKQEHSH